MLSTTALLTDRYELTMLQAARNANTADRRCVFEVFTRHLPAGRRYGVVAGTARLLELIENFRFDTATIAWLKAEKVVDDATIEWLANYRFSGDISGYREGEIFFANSPVLTVESSFAEAILLETLILSILNSDSSVAAAASRMVTAADGKFLAEMGGRRVNEHAAVAVARAAYIAGFDATSNLEAGRSWGIKTMGTAAHSFVLLHDSEEQAFKAQLDTFGEDTTLLVDTYDVEAAVRKAVALAPNLGGVRLDSGDLGVEVKRVRELLDSLGAAKTKITVTNDLDEFSIATLASSAVDAFGVGTSVATGSGAPTAGFVYKLVALEGSDGQWRSVAKRSSQKSNIGGRKHAVRRIDAQGIATAEVVGSEVVVERNSNDRELTVNLVRAGQVLAEFVGAEATKDARSHHRAAKAEMPPEGLLLSPGEAAIATEFI